MERDARLQSLPFTYLSESPIKGPRPGSPTGHLWRELPVSRTFLAYPNKQGLQMEQNITFYENSPYTSVPSLVPQRVHMKNDACFQSLHLHSLQGPQLRNLPTKEGEKLWSPSTEPHADGKPTYNVVRPGSPSQSFTTLLSLP